jgi:glycosyltransferase involved in cell wall biosynthesis
MGRRIGIFAGSAGSNSGGPERYETELLRAIAKLDLTTEYEVFCLFRDGPAKINVDAANFRYVTLRPSIRPIAMTTSLPAALWRSRLDVLHATFVPPPITPCDYAFTLVCSSMFEHPEFYPPAIRLRLQVLMGLAVRKAKVILCTSPHIQDVIRERFGVTEERSVVVPLAASSAFHPIPKAECAAFVRDRYGIEGPYLLFSGRWERRKNVARILEAFHRFRQETGAPHRLVLTGERTWAADEADAVIRRERMEDEIIDLGKSPVAELPWLYAGADALVYCSLWEGFGMPIVEAMRAGTPVITSNTSSMGEIGGDAALLVDPYSVEAIAEAMHRVTIGDPTLAGTMREKGLARGSTYSWERTARETLAAYERI